MKISQRKYSGEADKREMIQLAREFQSQHLHVIDLPYRLSSWALDELDNVNLWVDENDRLVAWAVMQTPFWTVDYVLKPGVERELHPQILCWVGQRAHAIRNTPYGHLSWFVNCFADQAERRQELEQAGFTSQSEAGDDAWSKVWMERDGKTDVPSYPLPKGFSMRSLAGASEVEAYVDLHQAVFETKNMTGDWRKRMLTQPDYRSDLDIVIAAPDGRLVAFCIGWISLCSDGKILGQIEPLGCLPDYRRYALGRVALCEALQRLHQLGAVKIYVETDNYRDTAFRLYESLGFRVIRKVLVYRKDYNASSC
jgi:ribosomal protein S18 acetylase RimI-like enzyme